MSGQVQPLRDVMPDVPPELEQICARALARNPEARHPTAAALQGELDAYLVQRGPRVSERELGKAVSELFADEHREIRKIIEHQLKGTGGVPHSLPHLNQIVAQPSLTRSQSGFEPSSPISVSVRTMDEQPVLPPPLPPLRRRVPPTRLAAAGLAVLLALGAVALFKLSRRKPATPAPGATAQLSPPEVPQTARGVSDTEILMGMSAAFSGPSRELGARMKLGIETAFDAINENGGIAGRKLRLVALDDGYEGKRALENVRELIEKRGVFGIIGNVGTPTALLAMPYVVSKKTLFFGAFTGANLLRRDPPDRYVFNYRASYEEETGKMVHYLVEAKQISPRGIVVFAQHDAYGDAGYDGAGKMMRKMGHGEAQLLRAGYERNTVDVDSAVNQIIDYHHAASVTHSSGGRDIYHPKHPVKAIIMVATYKAAVRFIQKIRDAKIDPIFLNVSFVGSNALAEELKELGPHYGENVIVTQVVPNVDSEATGIIRYRETLTRLHPDQHADFLSLEGYIVGQLFAEGLRRAGRTLDTEKLIDALESIRDLDLGTGAIMSFGMSVHQSSHKVWGTTLDEQFGFKSIDLE
jgi:ABC-type branched-subunit amino acid transport system substrate-binding protein